MKRVLVGVAALSFLPLTAYGDDLMQVFRDAQAYDAQYASARAARDAGRENLPQGLALLLPSISASASTQWNDVDVSFRGAFPPSPRQGNTNSVAFTLTQPLFNWQSISVYKQAGFKVAQAEALYSQAVQDLIVRTAQAYFDVQNSQDSLAFIQAQKVAISEQLAQAKRNFEVGTATITDTHEAQARYDLAVSQEIAAQNDLEIKRRTLQQITGKVAQGLLPLRSKIDISPPNPNVMDTWAKAAEAQNFAVRVQEAGVEIAKYDIERNRAGHLPTLNLVGNVGKNSSAFSSIGVTSVATDTISRSVGVQLAIPLYSGGSVDSLVRQAIANRDKAEQDLLNSRRSAELAARQAFLGVTNGIAQVKALEAALVSSQSALDSNKLGYEVGVRINIDVLNAQQQVFSTKRDLSKARYDTIVNGLKLKAAAGTLAESDIEEVNRLLGTD